LGERHFDKAIEYSQKAVSLDPNDPEGYVMLGYHLTKAGEHQLALETIQKAFRLNPIPPPYYCLYLGNIQINNRQYRKAIESINKAGPDTPGGFRYELVVSHVYLDEMEEAKKELSVIEKDWKVNIWSLNRLFFLKNKVDQDHWLDAFRKIGVQEYPYAYEGDEKNILSKEEVLNLIVDKKITGIDPKKGQFWIHHTKDGKWRSTGAYKFDGTYWLEDNKLCHTVSGHPGFIDYVFFYRNPGGTSLGKNEYYMYYPFFGTWTVSVEK
jgi:tetratricopeptide (TPR) repeat protein